MTDFHIEAYLCGRCKTTFDTLKGLKIHQATYFIDTNNSCDLVCNKCLVQFETSKKYKKHIKDDICDKEEIEKALIPKHLGPIPSLDKIITHDENMFDKIDKENLLTYRNLHVNILDSMRSSRSEYTIDTSGIKMGLIFTCQYIFGKLNIDDFRIQNIYLEQIEPGYKFFIYESERGKFIVDKMPIRERCAKIIKFLFKCLFWMIERRTKELRDNKTNDEESYYSFLKLDLSGKLENIHKEYDDPSYGERLGSSGLDNSICRILKEMGPIIKKKYDIEY